MNVHHVLDFNQIDGTLAKMSDTERTLLGLKDSSDPLRGRAEAVRPSIYQFWHDGNPPAYIQELINSWIGKCPEFVHRLFDDASAGDFVRASMGERYYRAFHACRLPAMRADLFRLCVLFTSGGVYVDADQSCRTSIYPLYECCDRGCLHIRSYPALGMIAILNGFIIVKRPGDPLFGKVLEIAIRNVENPISNNVFDVTGPGIINDLWENGDVTLFDRLCFMPEKQIRRLMSFHPQLPYKQTGQYWLQSQRTESIFTDAATGTIPSAAGPPATGLGPDRSVFDGIDFLLSPLARATEFSRCAASTGLEPTEARVMVAQITERAAMLAHGFDPSADPAKTEEQVGELLLAAASLARTLQVEPEGALRRATAAFEQRFRRLERHAIVQARDGNRRDS